MPHRYEEGGDRVHFVRVDRAQHRAAPFLTDEYLPQARAATVLARADAVAGAAPAGPLHFIFHSAFCCSTLLARALDVPGVAMGMSEPVVLNDIIGWRHRGGTDGRKVAMVLDQMLGLLARPFGPGEAVVVKASNLVNPLAPVMLAMRPEARAVLLFAPLEQYLGSIARKGMWSRVWVRDLLAKLLREGWIAGFGIEGEALLKLTDVQVAALGWLAQHRQFAMLAAKYGPERVRTLNSETLLAQPEMALGAVAGLFGLALDAKAAAGGPAFGRHSKSGEAFDRDSRVRDAAAAMAAHGEEIAMVATWARAVAKAAGVRELLPGAVG